MFYKKEQKQIELLHTAVQQIANQNHGMISDAQLDTTGLEGVTKDIANIFNQLLKEAKHQIDTITVQQAYDAETFTKQIQQIQQNETVRLNHVLESNHIGMWEQSFVNGETVRYTYSQTAREILGYHTIEEFPDAMESWANTVHPEDKNRVFAAYMTSLDDRTGNTLFEEEHRCYVRGKGYRWFLGVSHVVRDEKGVPVSLVGCFQDIHDKKMEIDKLNELLRQADMIDKALSLSPVASEGIWGLTVHTTVTDDTECWFSPQVKGLLGVDETMEFRPVFSGLAERVHKEDLVAFRQCFNVSRNKAFKEKIRMRHENGTYRWFNLVGEVMADKAGHYKTIAGSLIDITKEEERKAHERILNTQLREFSDSIGEMVETINQLALDAQSISTTYLQTAQSVQTTKSSIDQTKDITNLIKSIAEQINLLGLNANIEAARAGVHGSGFAVVANEVRDLAINSTKATENIEDIMNGIRESANGILLTMDALQQQVQVQVDTTKGVNTQAKQIEQASLILLESFKKLQ